MFALLAWTTVFALQLEQWASGVDRYVAAVGVVEQGDSGLELDWDGLDGADYLPLDNWQARALQAHVGQRVPVRYQPDGDGAYLIDLSDPDPDTLIDPFGAATVVPLALVGGALVWLLSRRQRRLTQLRAALAPDAPRTRVPTSWWTARTRSGWQVSLLYLGDPAGAAGIVLGHLAAQSYADIGGALTVRGPLSRGHLLVVEGPDGQPRAAGRVVGWGPLQRLVLRDPRPVSAPHGVVPRGWVRSVRWCAAYVALLLGSAAVGAAGDGATVVAGVCTGLATLAAVTAAVQRPTFVRLTNDGILVHTERGPVELPVLSAPRLFGRHLPRLARRTRMRAIRDSAAVISRYAGGAMMSR